MKRTGRALAALLGLASAACGRAGEEPAVGTGEAALARAPAVVAQTTAGKPLIHVWKSPT